jgi:uncharacterized membrane protein
MTIEQLQAKVDRLTDAKEWRAAEAPLANLNEMYQRSFSRLDRLAIWVTDNVGSMGFFFLIAAWTLVWLGWNTLGPRDLRFDPAPAFVVWLFISNLIQLHLMPLLLIGQNLQDRQSELRAQLDFEISERSEREIETVLEHLTNENQLLVEIVRRLERIEGRGAATSG